MSFYNSPIPKQWKWKPGVYFKQEGQVFRLDSWITASKGLAWVRPFRTNYSTTIELWISAAAWRVRKDGKDYKRTSCLSSLARKRNSDLGRLAGIEKNLENLIRHSLSSARVKTLLLRNVDYTLQAVRAQIDYEWRKQQGRISSSSFQRNELGGLTRRRRDGTMHLMAQSRVGLLFFHQRRF